MRLFFACNASSSPPVVPLPPCSSTSLARPGDRISLSNPLALPVVNRSQRLCGRRQASQTLSRAHEDVERFSLPQGSSALCTIDLTAFAECPEASQLLLLRSLLSLLPILFPRPTSGRLSLQGVCSRRSSLYVVPKIRTHSLCSSTVELPKNFESTKVGLARADLLRLTLPLPLSAQGTGANLTRLRRDLVADFAVVALAAMLDATVDSEPYSTSCATSCSGSILTWSSSNLLDSSL